MYRDSKEQYKPTAWLQRGNDVHWLETTGTTLAHLASQQRETSINPIIHGIPTFT